MNNELLISIITPSYNSGRTIERTLKSVFDQTYSNIEYIIVDGGSNDNTVDTIKKYEEYFLKRGVKFKYISEKDNGIADAFNKGIALATGDYVGIVNSDDWLEIDAVRNIVDNIDSKHVVYFGDLNLYDKGHLIKRRKSRYHLLWLGMYIMHPTVFVKRSLYEKYKFDTELKISMDFDLLLDMRKNFRKGFKYLPYVISNMELGGASANLAEMRREELMILRKHHSKVYYCFILMIKSIEKILF